LEREHWQPEGGWKKSMTDSCRTCRGKTGTGTVFKEKEAGFISEESGFFPGFAVDSV